VVMPAVAIAILTVGVNLLVDSLSGRDLSQEQG
jgi:ABC-type dipeptide/oligopeptide/nickel transport system permease subunit